MSEPTAAPQPATRPRAPDVFSARDLRNRSGDLMRNAEQGRLAVITRHGRPAIVAVPFDDRLLLHGVQRAVALSLFESGKTTLGQSAKLAGLSQEAFIELLGELGIPAV
ncbi:MAG: type II toxin-antitoxin system prevent-host-death family antitoxin, partial [bacterium]|nr:type II toxin-antitoxin system prevent-host-death family antitoxin [bacterium]